MRERWYCEIPAASAEYADLPAAEGTLRNTATGLEIEIWVADWLTNLSDDLLLPHGLPAEIDVDILLRPTAAGDLFVAVTRIRWGCPGWAFSASPGTIETPWVVDTSSRQSRRFFPAHER